MTMISGTVTIDQNGTPTKTAGSMAEAIYDELVKDLTTTDFHGNQKPTEIIAAEREGSANLANRIAAAVVPYVLNNLEARAVITAANDSALQRTVTTGGACSIATDCGPPSFDKTLFAKAVLT